MILVKKLKFLSSLLCKAENCIFMMLFIEEKGF